MRSFGGAGNASVGDGTGNGTVPLPAGDGRLEHVDIIVPRAYQYSLNWSQARPLPSVNRQLNLSWTIDCLF